MKPAQCASQHLISHLWKLQNTFASLKTLTSFRTQVGVLHLLASVQNKIRGTQENIYAYHLKYEQKKKKSKGS